MTFSCFFLFSLGKKVRYMVKPSSVTKRHIMGGMDKAFGIVFTPHQWHHSDRKCPLSTQFQKPKINQFFNWLIIHPKVVNSKNKCLYHHFGGMLAWKIVLRFWIRALKVPLFSTQKWALFPKVPAFRCPKMGLWVSESKNGGHFLTPTSPQNGDIDICFMRLPLLDE